MIVLGFRLSSLRALRSRDFKNGYNGSNEPKPRGISILGDDSYKNARARFGAKRRKKNLCYAFPIANMSSERKNIQIMNV